MSTDGAGSRKTRAIMFSDIKGYSKLMGEDETRALRLLDEHNALVVPTVKAHGGQVLKFIGDAVLASYESAADAVLAATEIQQALARRNAQAAANDQIRVRIGIHVGDVVLKGDDVFGDGVNIASRLEPQAEPGGIAISQTVHDMVRALPEIRTESMGVRELKNISQPMQVYRVCFEGAPPAAVAKPVQEAKPNPAPVAVPSVPAVPAVPQVPFDLSKLSRRERRRFERAQSANPFEAAVWIAAALACLGYAVYRPEMWWMIFVALGPAKRAAAILGRSKSPQPALAQPVAAPAPIAQVQQPAAPDAAEKAKLDALCDKLTADLAAAPAIAREVIKNPEKTVAGLRSGCHTLLQRAAQLRSLSGAAELARLDAERQNLASKMESDADPVTRGRLQAALDAIDAQRKQREELAAMAGRLDAEYTRLYYALENLHMQVMRVRSADLAVDPQQTGLRQTAERLVSEMDAVAQALEELNCPAATEPIVPVGADADASRLERARVR